MNKKGLLFKLIGIMAFAIIIAACASAPENASTQTKEEENVIINTVINHVLTNELKRKFDNNNINIFVNKLLYVDNFFEDTCGCFEDDLAGYEHTYENMVKYSEYYLTELEINYDTIKSFISNNINKIFLDYDIQFESLVLLNEEIYNHTHSLITLSNIGFNIDKTEALIHISIKNPFHLQYISYGKYIYLIKENGTWKVKKDIYSWLGP
ncbi:MAG: hypothetical protein FWD13_08470 [Treponema sp.]|nr:hypothetical protein [Treponema sp.]